MKNIDGILEFEYKSILKRIKFSLDLSPGYGGLPLLLVQDRYGYFHTFIRDQNTGWHPLGKTPSWPSDFLVMLCLAMEEKYMEARAWTKI